MSLDMKHVSHLENRFYLFFRRFMPGWRRIGLYNAVKSFGSVVEFYYDRNC